MWTPPALLRTRPAANHTLLLGIHMFLHIGFSESYKYHCLELYYLFWTSLAATAFSTLAQLIAINAS